MNIIKSTDMAEKDVGGERKTRDLQTMASKYIWLAVLYGLAREYNQLPSLWGMKKGVAATVQFAILVNFCALIDYRYGHIKAL